MISHQAATKQTKTKTISSNLMYIVALAYPLTTIPQIITIFRNRSSANISLASWSLYALCAFVTLVYAITHRLKPLIIEGVLWSIMYTAIIIGIVTYR